MDIQQDALERLDSPEIDVPSGDVFTEIVSFRLSSVVRQHLTQLAAAASLPLSAAIIASWSVLLARWSLQEQLRIKLGTGTGRDLQVRVSADPSFAALLQDSSAEWPREAVDELARNRHVVAAAAEQQAALSISEDASGVVTLTCYGSADAEPGLTRRRTESWKVLLAEIGLNPEGPVSQLPILTAREREDSLRKFNKTTASFPAEALIHELFEEQARRVPLATAVVFGKEALTFAQVNQRANQLARYLRLRGVVSGDLVGLCLERSAEMVISILASLKAGAAYVPFDPGYPRERLEFMRRDSSPRLIVTQQHLVERLGDSTTAFISLESIEAELQSLAATDLPASELQLTSHHPAFVIYTSGSTGTPKAAVNEHRGMVNRIIAQQSIEAFTPDDICCQKAALSFVDAVFEVLAPLCHGLPLVVMPALAARDPRAMAEIIAEQGITRLITVPSLARSMCESAQIMRNLGSLRTWTLSGEPVAPDLVAKLEEHLPECEFINQYGSSEVSSDVACFRGEIPSGSRVPIGRPVPNVRVYILDSHKQPVPLGVAGEIYVGGVGVGRGYLGRPDLTSERFTSDPFEPDQDARLYRMGDLGRWRSDGLLECLGRADNQVKIRGIRIELAEIEYQIMQSADVHETVVLAREVNGESRLVAYITTHDSGSDEAAGVRESLRASLRARLPEHMVPAAVVVLPEFPRMPNGKVDRRALPAPGMSDYAVRPYEEPQGEIEVTTAHLWQELLNIERIGRNDHFFELGGSSLTATRMIERLRDRDLKVELREIFLNPTLQEVARRVRPLGPEGHAVSAPGIPEGCRQILPSMIPLTSLDANLIDRVISTVPGGVENIQDIYPLAPLQHGILFQTLRGPDAADPYVLSVLLSASSKEALEEFAESTEQVMQRHDVLRTSIQWDGLPQPIHVVHRHVPLPTQTIELAPDLDVAEQLEKLMMPTQETMDVTTSPLLRLQVFHETQSNKWYGILRAHHLVCDHRSLQLLFTEIDAFMRGAQSSLHPPGLYRDHVAHALQNARVKEAESYFRERLGQVDQPSAPFGLIDTEVDAGRTLDAKEPLDAELSLGIREIARRVGTTPATIFHAAWALVVCRTTGRDEAVFGTVLLGGAEDYATTRPSIGMFINTLPLRVQASGTTALELVRHTHDELAELLSYEEVSLSEALRCSAVNSSEPLFTTILNYLPEGTGVSETLRGSRGTVRILRVGSWTNYPIAVSVEEKGPLFELQLTTDFRLNPESLAGNLRAALTSLVEALQHNPQAPAVGLDVISSSERWRLLQEFNSTDRQFPYSQTVHGLFEQRAAEQPFTVAITEGTESWTYEELNAHANRLAYHLAKDGLIEGEHIAVLLPRSYDLIVAQLAALKGGAAYVPVDPELPADRLEFLVKDCGARQVIGRGARKPWIPESVEWVDLATRAEEIRQQPAHNPRASAASSSTAYVMYTSGSTGTPKGVMIAHRSINRLVINNTYADIRSDDRLAFCSNPAFDASTFEVWAALLNGAQLVIVPQQVLLDPHAFSGHLMSHQVSILFLTVGLFTRYVGPLNTAFSRLRYLMTGGDVVDPGRLREVLHSGRPGHLLNAYGPTECATFASTFEVSALEERAHRIPIGKPIGNTRIYIVDQRMQLVPIGAAGEICLGGPGVALGYLNRPELTRERFVPDPFSDQPGARLYRTGDLGRWAPDGNIEFIGRNDRQIKLRGYRIELPEIEARILQQPEVKEALVVVREDVPGDKRLVAYVTCNPEREISVEELRANLLLALPPYMVPSAIVTLGRMPLTPNGKLDRRALPAPTPESYESHAHVPPMGAVETAVAAVWEQVLQRKPVGRTDNFFELGGHSLLALSTVAMLNERLQSRLRVSDLYQSSTVQGIAALIQGATVTDDYVDLEKEAVLDQAVRATSIRMRDDQAAILLTGATGFVGRFLLTELLRHTQQKIYCLIRARSEGEAFVRLSAQLVEWDLWKNDMYERIVAIPGDLSKPQFGLQARAYGRLRTEVDEIFHCGTSMNHLESYESARPTNVAGVRQFLELASEGRTKLLNYVSTVSVFSAHGHPPERRVNEATPIAPEKHRRSDGYGASKWVGEYLVEIAAARGIPCNVFRLGLVWPDTRYGRYDELQREYRILKSCLLSGYGIRNYGYDTEPVAVDFVAKAMVTLARRYPQGGGTFHLTSMQRNAVNIFERLNAKGITSLTLLPFHEWILELKRLHDAGQSLPATPLLEFAFNMTEQEFAGYLRDARASEVKIEATRTITELVAAGVGTPPPITDEALRSAVQDLLARDPELRKQLILAPRETSSRSTGTYGGAL